MLDDAVLVGPVTVTPSGDLTAATVPSGLHIMGSVPPGGSVNVTYSVRVQDPTLGDGVLDNFVLPTGEVPPQVCLPDQPLCTTHPVAPRLTLVKAVSFGSEPTNSWTLAATGPSGELPGPTGSHSETSPVTGFVTANQAYVLSESGGPATYQQVGGWVCEDVRPVSSGERFELDAATINLLPGADVTCVITNATARITLLKHVTAGPGEPADWNLSLTPKGGTGLTVSTVAGADHHDSGNAANSIEVLPGHAYVASEALAGSSGPVTYRLKELQIRQADGSWTSIDPAAELAAPQPGQSVVYRFVNEPIAPVSLPLTGGTPADAVRLTGTALLVVAGVALAASWLRRRQHGATR